MNAINQVDIICIYRGLHVTMTEHTPFSDSHKTFQGIEHILSHKQILLNWKNCDHANYIL